MIQRIRDCVLYGWQLVEGFRANHEINLANARQQDIAPYLDQSSSLRILDLANGSLRPQYILLKAAKQRVYGIDIINRPRYSWLNGAYLVARWLYARKLGVTATTMRSKTLVCGDVSALPFWDNSMDLVTSIAAFEHFYRVPDVLAEVHRVLRPGGMAWICIHLFSSPSGGHNVSITQVPLQTLPSGVDPWDHLRKHRLPFHVPLNQWRQKQYLDAFSRHFEIIKHYCAMREGEEYLTPAIEAELSDYSRDELTCGAYVILARKAL